MHTFIVAKEKYEASLPKVNVHFEQNFQRIVRRQQSPRSQPGCSHPQASSQDNGIAWRMEPRVEAHLARWPLDQLTMKKSG